MLATSHVFEGEPSTRKAVATAVVAHPTAEAALLKTDRVQMGVDPLAHLCAGALYVIDHLVPVFGTQIE